MKPLYHSNQRATEKRATLRNGLLWTSRTAAFCLLLSAQNVSYAFDWFGWFGDDESDVVAETQPQGPVLIDQPHKVRDLAYGDLLFEYYQQHYFTAITKILVAQERGLLEHHQEHAELVLGSLYVSYGMLDRGEAIFNQLLNAYTTPQGADEAWYQLARIHYKRGNPEKALQVLKNNIREPMETRSTEHLLLQILCEVQLGQVESARTLTHFLDDNETDSVFVRFNMGAALSQLGRVDQAAEFFQQVLDNDHQLTEPDLTLHDRAALSLGVYYMQTLQWDKAEEVLHQIRLYGPVADRGLLALGWARFENNRKLEALGPWMELNNRSLTDISVQESLLNVPFVYEELGALQDSLAGYKNAFEVFAAEKQRLDDIKTEILKPNWIEVISPVDTAEMGVMNATNDFQLPKDNDATQHLYQYFAGNEFQRMYQDYRELQRLYLVLINWERQLPVFDEMIETHMQRLDELAPAAQVATEQAQRFYAYSRVKLDEFETRLSQIIANDDIAGTATVDQLAHRTRLESVETNLRAMGGADRFPDEWEKLKLLKGLLAWDMNSEALDKRWQSTKDKVAIDNLLVDLEETIRNVNSARETRVSRFVGFESRIQTLQQQIESLKDDTAATLRDQRNVIQKAAVEIIEKQQVQLDRMQAKSLLSIARLQDLAYTQKRDRDAQQYQNPTPADPEAATEPTSDSPADPNPVSEPTEGANEPDNLGDVIKGIFSDD